MVQKQLVYLDSWNKAVRPRSKWDEHGFFDGTAIGDSVRQHGGGIVMLWDLFTCVLGNPDKNRLQNFVTSPWNQSDGQNVLM